MAIHVALKISGLDDADSVAAYLGITKKETARILDRLIDMGLVKRTHGKYQRISGKSLVLDEDPVLVESILRASSNYLSDALARAQKTGNYYASFVALSHAQMLEISGILSRATGEIHKIGLRPKSPEHVYFVGMGFARASVQE